jgi:hypothetical protein
MRLANISAFVRKRPSSHGHEHVRAVTSRGHMKGVGVTSRKGNPSFPTSLQIAGMAPYFPLLLTLPLVGGGGCN